MINTTNRERRFYRSPVLPTLREGMDIAQNKDLLLALYNQVCSIWKELIEVRFKLWSFGPGVTFVLLVTVLSTKGPAEGLSQAGRLLISVFGLLVTLGLYVFDSRNTELHDDLISRGRKIEDELGVDTGIFRGRRMASGVFTHRLIYGSSVLAWLVVILFVLRHW
jgi:hypothetical protein